MLFVNSTKSSKHDIMEMSGKIDADYKRNRALASNREKKRLRKFNAALGALQNTIPVRMSRERKLSTKQTLKLATRYIQFLDDCLDGKKLWHERSQFWFQIDSSEVPLTKTSSALCPSVDQIPKTTGHDFCSAYDDGETQRIYSPCPKIYFQPNLPLKEISNEQFQTDKYLSSQQNFTDSFSPTLTSYN